MNDSKPVGQQSPTVELQQATYSPEAEAVPVSQSIMQTEEPVELQLPPDGGYGWVCVGACFFINCFSWGLVAVSYMSGNYTVKKSLSC